MLFLVEVGNLVHANAQLFGIAFSLKDIRFFASPFMISQFLVFFKIFLFIYLFILILIFFLVYERTKKILFYRFSLSC